MSYHSSDCRSKGSRDDISSRVQIIDYDATEPSNGFNESSAIVIPSSPFELAIIHLSIPRQDSRNNRVELIATVGVRGVTDIAQIKFRIFRDDVEIFNTIVGIESTDSEQNYVVTFQAIDSKLKTGKHSYRLTVENLTPGATAEVVGPISFSGLALSQPKDE